MKDLLQTGRTRVGSALFLALVAAGIVVAIIFGADPFHWRSASAGSVSLHAGCFRQEPSPGWLKGNCKGYQEGDWVPERLAIANGTNANLVVDPAVAITLSMDYFDSRANAIGFDDIRNVILGSCEQTPSADFNNWVPTGAAIPFAPVGWTPPGVGIPNPPATQAFTFPASGSFTVPAGQTLCVYWQAHMSLTPFWNLQSPAHDGSAFWSGASLHVHIDMPNTGSQDVPIEVPEIAATVTPTATPTNTNTPTPTNTNTPTETNTPTPTNTNTPTPTNTNTPTPTSTFTPTPTNTNTPTPTNTFTPTPTNTNTPTPTNTVTPTPQCSGLDVVIIIDCTGSMITSSNNVDGHTRLYWAKQAALELVNGIAGGPDSHTLGNNHVEYMTFGGGTATVLQPFSSNADAVRSSIIGSCHPLLDTDTAIAPALQQATGDLNAHVHSGSYRTVVLLSDGRNYMNGDPTYGTFCPATHQRRANTVAAIPALHLATNSVYTVGIGDDTTCGVVHDQICPPENCNPNELDPYLLMDIAESPGDYTNVPDASDLPDIYAAISQEVVNICVNLSATNEMGTYSWRGDFSLSSPATGTLISAILPSTVTSTPSRSAEILPAAGSGTGDGNSLEDAIFGVASLLGLALVLGGLRLRWGARRVRQ